MFFNFLCISAFKQGHLEPCRYRNAFINIIIIIIHYDSDLCRDCRHTSTVCYLPLPCVEMLSLLPKSKKVTQQNNVVKFKNKLKYIIPVVISITEIITDITLPYLTTTLLNIWTKMSASINLYINLRRTHDGTRLFGCLLIRVEVCVWVSDPRFIQFTLGSCYAVHINVLSI